MPSYVAFLRAVNVGGKGPLPMQDLRDLVERLGGSHVETLLTTGNVLFHTSRPVREGFRSELRSALRRGFRLDTEVLLRTLDEMANTLTANPFPTFAERDPSHLVVYFLHEPPSSALARTFSGSIPAPERAEVRGRELFVCYPQGIARSKVTLPFLERRLGTGGTGRNWNTVRRVHVGLVGIERSLP